MNGERSTFQSPVSAPCFRKEFCLEQIETASVNICGLGFYELFLNGKRITRGRLSPYISNPDHAVYCDVYDVTEHLKKGKNVIGVMLGNGNLNCIGGQVWKMDNTPYTDAPKFALEFTMGDVFFDASSFVAHRSPIIFDDLRSGEWYDARLELGAWTTPDYDDSGWSALQPAEAPRGEITVSEFPPITVEKELRATSFRRGKISIHPNIADCLPVIPFGEGEEQTEGWLYDFGENTTGVCRLKIKNTKPGQKVILQFGEILGDETDDPKVTIRGEECGLDLRSFHFLPARYNNRDVYICKGAEEEIWEPNFTYHGFQYCLVTGIDDDQATEELLTAVVWHTELKGRASFTCSDETVNKLWEATIRSDLGNFFHFPTDCPHREKNGWTGDAAISAEQLLMAFSCESNLAEWLKNIRYAMLEDGQLPPIIPGHNKGYGQFGPAWDDALIEVAYQIWRQRGDLKIIYDNADAFLKYMSFLSAKRDGSGLVRHGLGDWCQVGRPADKPAVPSVFTSTVIATKQCRRAAIMFRAVGMEEQAVYAETLSDELREAARKHLIDRDAKTAIYREQTAQAMAIYYGIFDESEKAEAVKVLLTLIEEKGGSFECGILGMRVLFHVLSEFGHTDLALNMIVKPQFPSYGYWIANGATTLWELFAPYERCISSLNHHFFGDIISWFMQNLVGIKHNPDDSNVNNVLIQPRFAHKLTFAEGSVCVPAGNVHVRWERTDSGVTVRCTVPEGVQATLCADNGYRLENGKTAIPLPIGESEQRVKPAVVYGASGSQTTASAYGCLV